MRDAAAREQSHPVGAEEPRCTLGRIPRVGVLGQEDQQAPAELFVERGQHEREGRLRHARPGGQRFRERLESIAGGELGDEGVKGRLVHANGGKRAPPGHRYAPLHRTRPQRPPGAPPCPYRHASDRVVTGVCRL